MARNLKLTLAYDGADFHGWQVQPERHTIQGTLADAIERVTSERVLPQGSGRTDAGVHALAQVASCALSSPIPARNLVKALNDVLPPAIRISTVEEVEDGFHARHSAIAKTYRYRIYRGETCPPHLARYVTHYPFPLDQGRMQEAAKLVEGQHDFTSFAAVDLEKGKAADPQEEQEEKNEKEPSSVRTIFSSQWERQGEELVYTVVGNGFLHHMVRNLVGTFLLVGKGTLSAADLPRILQSRQRSAAGPTAPASGLWLVGVKY
ncbi:MAG TPA: tRNA pseudouridine(38-40) synthase TruA [Terriglobales bacterium]|jgi:tRNA pseudouridine38-40 synthase|nr:tRNA pseudouridine(38-40) synthase TruA [Terriglobales bacterium]